MFWFKVNEIIYDSNVVNIRNSEVFALRSRTVNKSRIQESWSLYGQDCFVLC